MQRATIVHYFKRALWIARFVMGAQLFGFFVAFAFWESEPRAITGTLTVAVIGFFIIAFILLAEIAWLIIRTRRMEVSSTEHEGMIVAGAAIYLFDAITLILGTVTAFALLYMLCPVIDAESITGKQALYFSMVTFSTLGYGDLTPREDFQLIAAGEALLGLVVFGLLIGYASTLFSVNQRLRENDT